MFIFDNNIIDFYSVLPSERLALIQELFNNLTILAEHQSNIFIVKENGDAVDWVSAIEDGIIQIVTLDEMPDTTSTSILIERTIMDGVATVLSLCGVEISIPEQFFIFCKAITALTELVNIDKSMFELLLLELDNLMDDDYTESIVGSMINHTSVSSYSLHEFFIEFDKWFISKISEYWKENKINAYEG